MENKDIKYNYGQFLNGIALGVNTKPAMIPDYKLMVGTAENLESQPVIIYKDVMNPTYRALTKQLASLENDQVSEDLIGQVYEPDDFVNETFWLGEPVSASGV